MCAESHEKGTIRRSGINAYQVVYVVCSRYICIVTQGPFICDDIRFLKNHEDTAVELIVLTAVDEKYLSGLPLKQTGN